MHQAAYRTSLYVVIAIVSAALAIGGSASAHWLSELGELAATAGKAGKVGGKLGAEMSAGMAGAARLLDGLPALAKKSAVAAEALPDGAWRFRNAAGDAIIATSGQGVADALRGLGMDGTDVSVYLTSDAAFSGPAAIEALPEAVKLHVVSDDTPYPLLRQGKGETAKLFAEIDGNVIVGLTNQQLFGEALWQLRRPLGKSGVRIASLDTRGPAFLPSVGVRTAEGAPSAETIAAGSLGSGLAAMRGQTLIVTGGIEGDLLRFTGISGESGSVRIADVIQAAESQDVNLLLLDAGTARQPGGTTWLFQTRGISHLERAMAEETLGDFISALAKGQGRLEIAADWGQSGHLRLSAVPATAQAPVASAEAATAGLAERTLDFGGELARSLAGHVVPHSATASLNSRDTQWDLDNRLIPGIPTQWQIMYAVSWICGLLGFSMARWWWRLVSRTRGSHLSRLWRLAYETGYWFIFSPLVGPLALASVGLWSVVEQMLGIWRVLTWPFRRRRARA